MKRLVIFTALVAAAVLLFPTARAEDPIIAPAPNWLFIRGDANIDGQVDIADMLDSLGYLFGGNVPHCLAAHDANDDGMVDIADVLYTGTYLFSGGPPPPAPFPRCGFDPTKPAAGYLPCDWNYLCQARTR